MERWRWGEPVARLRACLAAGGVLAIPTESSYGLAVDPRDAAGVEAVYRIKGRERGKALPVVAAELAQLAELEVDLDEVELARLGVLWPAPLTVVVPVGRAWPAAAGGGTLAVRIPAHERLRGLLHELGPLTATSANLAAAPPCLEPEELRPLLEGHRAIVVDDGSLPGGPPSSLVAWDGKAFHPLRPGAFDLGASNPFGRSPL